MTESQNTNGADGAAITGNVLLYKNPQPLSLEAHGKLGLKNIAMPFGFVAKTHVVPVTIQEFGIAASTMPIIFAPDKKTPLAVLAARGNENLFVDASGNWEMDAYVPAFVRRYPFIFAADEGNENFVVCVDESAEMIGENPDLPLFVDDKPTDYTNGAMEFLQDFERQRRATEEWVELINSMDLLEDKSVTFTPNDENGKPMDPIKVADYVAISEEKLMALPDDKFVELKNKGALAAIYSHLVSLLHWQKMVQRTLRAGEMQPAANA